MKFRHRVVMITGASAGLGRATAREFAGGGAKIGLLARGREGLEATRREVEELGGRGVVLPADVADGRAVDEAATKLEKALGPIDIWVNNAMTSVFSPVMEMTHEEYRRVTEVVYLGLVNGTLAALKRMRPRDHGKIIQIGSALSYRSIPLQSAYCAAKHAVNGFTESLWTELIHDRSRVSVTIVQMPALNTPQFRWVKSRMHYRAQPVPPIFQPEVGARAVVWAAARRRRELYVGLPTVKAILADKFAPGLLDHYLGKKGYEAQMTVLPEDPRRRFNLWRPVEGDWGAHGAFDAQAKRHSAQFWVRRHARWLGLGLLALAAAGCLKRAERT